MKERLPTEPPDPTVAAKISARRAGRMLIVDEHPTIRRMLANLISEQLDVDFCFEAENIEIASKTLDCQTVDFALVDISENTLQGARCTEVLKLRCPKLPVMAISVKTGCSDKTLKPSISTEQAERILAAIRYMQLLIRSGLSGFTVFVKAENGL